MPRVNPQSFKFLFTMGPGKPFSGGGREVFSTMAENCMLPIKARIKVRRIREFLGARREATWTVLCDQTGLSFANERSGVQWRTVPSDTSGSGA